MHMFDNISHDAGEQLPTLSPFMPLLVLMSTDMLAKQGGKRGKLAMVKIGNGSYVPLEKL